MFSTGQKSKLFVRKNNGQQIEIHLSFKLLDLTGNVTFILFVSGSDIDSEGLSRISEALKYNSIVETLGLIGNYIFSFD